MANVKRKSLINSPIMERPVMNFVSPLLRGRQSLNNDQVSEIDEIIDEAAEIKKRQIKRVAEVMQTHMVNSPATPNERQTPITISNFTTKNLMDHYAECIRLSTENKITMRNAFSLHLIDYMAEMFNNKDATDFQLASSTLDASAKIYSCRVDIIHSDMYKLLTGLGRGWNKNEAANEDDDDDKDDGMMMEGEDGQKKSVIDAKKRKVKKGKTIETNLKNITVNKNDQLNALDPVIAKTINDFNIGSCGGILLNRLHMYLDLPELVILPTSIAHIRERYVRPNMSQLIDVEEIINCKFSNERIRTTLTDLNFGEFTEEESKMAGSLNELRFNLNADYEEPDNVRRDENHHDIIDEGFGNVTISGDENDDAFPTNMNANESVQAVHMENTIANFKKGNMENLLQAIGTDQSEYAYFKTDFLQMWAGPANWKLKSRRVNNSSNTKSTTSKRLKKLDFMLDFSEDDEIIENKLKETKVAIIVTRNTLIKHNDRKNLLPDVKYEGDNLLRDFSYLECAICRKDNINMPMVNFDNYDYDNAADQNDYCAPAQALLNDDTDNMADNNSYDDVLDFNLTANTSVAHGDGGENNAFIPMDAIFEEAEVLEGDKLIAPLRKIAKMTIDYARVSKRIDVRLLKQMMWHIIEKNIGKLQTITTPLNNVSTSFCGSNILYFHDLFNQLKPRLPSPTRENISIHIAFVCLLHLANERTLKLTGQDDNSDIRIEINYCNRPNNEIILNNLDF